MNAPTAQLTPARDEVETALQAGVAWLGRTQDPDGSWPGNYGGPLFLLPLYIATCRIIGEPISSEDRDKMRRYLMATQNPDGGFGLHVEGKSTAYGTVTNYVAGRMLGMSSDHPRLSRARTWLIEHGGPVASASWGKFFLALMDLYPFSALNPVPPELWLLPESTPLHPSRLWCHCRMVYLPMSYLYRKGRAASGDPLIDELRAELYPQGYHSVEWEQASGAVFEQDNHSPPALLSRLSHRVLRAVDGALPGAVTRRAMEYVLHQIDREDRNTNYICIGPINKLLNTLVWFYEDPTGPELRSHRARLKDYLYETELVGRATSPHADQELLAGENGTTGLLMQGYNSSRLWDTAFATQALTDAAQVLERPADTSKNAAQTGTETTPGDKLSLVDILRGAADFIDDNQVRDDVCDADSAFRHRSKGGWPFSDRPHGWPISDCTAEGLKSSLGLLSLQRASRLDESGFPLGTEDLAPRMREAMEQVLSMQNADGGWATYELTRGPEWLEQLNPSNCFRDIMIDYSYVECTSASVQALAAFSQEYPEVEPERIQRAIEAGGRFLMSAQRSDGSFEGSWGVCFTYGTWFGIAGLRAAGFRTGHRAIHSARRFLESHQRPDGGWGESLENCLTRRYDPTTESQVVMTSWALLALMDAGAHQSMSVQRGILYLLERQRPDGTYPDENIAGVFNKTCAIHYDNYLKVFPVWAMARYLKRLPPGGTTSPQ